ncbi:MAG: PDDEXK nuclease domain-containing protein [Rhodocyclaceae bacterium]
MARKIAVTATPPIYGRVREILEAARSNIARTVNTTQVIANWLIGREIVEEEQKGKRRAGYGAALLADLAVRLKMEFGAGYGVDNLELCRRFYLEYPGLLPERISDAVRRKSDRTPGTTKNSETVRRNFEIVGAASAMPATPGQLSANLSWTHYRRLLRVGRPDAREFYEIEAIRNAWSARELERQINTFLFDRLAKSRDKVGLMRLASHGQEIASPVDAIKDPIVLEFLGLPESSRLVESKLEQALIGNLQTFLMELGKGFAFVSRQERNIFTSRYQLYLPTVEELENELRRELRFLSPPAAKAAPKTRKPKGQS